MTPTIEQVQIFRGNTVINKFYYSYLEPGTNKIRRRVCKNCSTYEESQNYVQHLKFLDNSEYLIKNICKNMYVENSQHMQRLKDFGWNISEKTCYSKRYYINLIVKVFGEYDISRIKISDIENYLIQNHKEHSGSWKNSFLETFGDIYRETKWVCNKEIQKPEFVRFARNSKKSSIFSTEELNIFFQEKNFDDYDSYLLFYFLANCGLRLGEARGLQVNQVDVEKHFLVVNGFCRNDGKKTQYNKCGSEDNKKWRVIPIPDDAYNKIIDYIHQRKIKGDDYIFIYNDKPYRQEYLRNIFIRALKRSSIKVGNRKLTPHSLRFTYVTRVRRDLPGEQVRKMVGHTNINMTDYYTVVAVPEMMKGLQNTFSAVNNLFK